MRFLLHALPVLIFLACSYACSSSSGSSASPSSAPATTPSTTSTTTSLPASQLALAGILSSGAGNCTLLDVESQNSNGIATAVTANETASLATSSSTGAFFSDSACTVGIASVALPSGGSDANVYYKDSTVGTANLTVTDTAGLGLAAGTGALTVTSIAQLAFVGSALSQSSTACGSLTLETRNSAGTATASTVALNVAVTSTSATGVFYSDNACTTAISLVTIPASQADSPAFYYKDSTDGAPTLSATESPSQNWKEATMTATIAN